MNEFLTIAEAAAKLKCSVSFLQKRCKEGVLPAVRVGTDYRIRDTDLDAFQILSAVTRTSVACSPKSTRCDDLLNLLDDWVAYLTHIKALSPATIRTHQTQMRTHLKRLGVLRGKQLTRDLLFERETLLAVFKTIPAASFALKLNTYNAIVSFGKYLIEEGMLAPNAVDDLKALKPRRQLEPRRTHLKSDDVTRLFDAILTRKHAVSDNATLAAAIATMVYGGLRVSEVIHLRPQDVDLNARVLAVRHGKGGKDRRIGIGQQLYGYLVAYAHVRPRGDSYFLQVDAQPYNKRMLQKRLSSLARRLDLDITCHGLRRTFATLAANQGRSVNSLRIALGHTNLETTQAYLRTSEVDVVREMATW